MQPTQSRLQGAKAAQPTYTDCYSRLEQIDGKRDFFKSVTARGKQVNSTRVNHDYTKERKVTSPISIEDLMEKEVQYSLEDGAICELSVLADPANED